MKVQVNEHPKYTEYLRYAQRLGLGIADPAQDRLHPGLRRRVKSPPLFISLLAALALAVPLAGRWSFPADGFFPGWKRSGPVETYAPAALYNVIDGGAELFLEMGFVDLRIQKYAGAGAEIAVEAYRMENAAAALGIYLLKCSRETPLPGIGERHSGDRFQVALLKNNYFIFINNFSGREDLLPVMTALAQRIVAAIPPGEPVRELDILPAADQVPGSGLLLRGPYSLQAVYTLGDGDVLQLEGKIFAAAAVYRDAAGPSHTLIVAPYADAAGAAGAFANLRRNLDPYHKVLEAGDDFFVFQDFQNLFGVAEVRGQRIEIRVKLAQRPPRPGEIIRYSVFSKEVCDEESVHADVVPVPVGLRWPASLAGGRGKRSLCRRIRGAEPVARGKNGRRQEPRRVPEIHGREEERPGGAAGTSMPPTRPPTRSSCCGRASWST